MSFTEKYKIRNKLIIWRTSTEDAWALVINPDGIRIDNYHRNVHIHPNRKSELVAINIKTLIKYFL